MLTTGTILQNRYLIKGLLGQGGMGAVYEAEAIHLGNIRVAVKETLNGGNQELREQFKREASMLARLRHSALPLVSDHFIEGDGQFLVMDFIPGEDLGYLLEGREQPFEPEIVMDWAEALLTALDHIHTQKPPIIHRDIKPANLRLTPDGRIFLLDFGLAKDNNLLSRSGKSLHAFTLSYAPPEQIANLGTDTRSDLYSLGATLYHLLTKSLPQDAHVREELCKHFMPDPLKPAHQLNDHVSFPFAAVIARAMSLNREDRYSSALEMRQALQKARLEPVGATLPMPPAEVTFPDFSSTAQKSGSQKSGGSQEQPHRATIPLPSSGSRGNSAQAQVSSPPSVHLTLPETADDGRKKKILIAAVGGVVLLAVLLFWWLSRPTTPVPVTVTTPSPTATVQATVTPTASPTTTATPAQTPDARNNARSREEERRRREEEEARKAKEALERANREAREIQEAKKKLEKR